MAATSFIERYRDRWDQRATVRCRPRRRPAESTQAGDYFPVVRQPLTIHPEVIALGPEARTFVLVQSNYKYMNDVALTETQVVSAITLRIANGQIGDGLPAAMRQIAMTVVVDETYHALVARDFIAAVQGATGIEPLPLPPEIELARAIKAAHAALPAELHDDFDVLAVCLAENTLTQEIVGLSRDGDLATPFLEALSDHLADEAQHAAFFQSLLTSFWSGLDAGRQQQLGAVLPTFIGLYLSLDIQSEFDSAILRAIGAPEQRIDKILQETHGGFELGPNHTMVQNICRLLDKTGVLGHEPTREAMAARGLLH